MNKPVDDWQKVEQAMWLPKDPNDSIEGVFIGMQTEVGENNSNLYTVEIDKKQLSFWGCTVLDGKMLSIKPGQQIKIVFLGMKQKEGKREYKDYDVFTKPLAL